MRAYIHDASLWCGDCGDAIIRRLIRAGEPALPLLDCRACGFRAHIGRKSFERFGAVPRFIGSKRALEIFASRNCAEWMRCPECAAEAMVFSDEDSDVFPAFAHVDGGESDSVEHCAAGENCRRAIQLADGSRVGAWLENGLSSEGCETLIAMVTEPNPTPYQKALHAFWREVYANSVDFPSDDDSDEDESAS